MSQKLPVEEFEWEEDILIINKKLNSSFFIDFSHALNQ